MTEPICDLLAVMFMAVVKTKNMFLSFKATNLLEAIIIYINRQDAQIVERNKIKSLVEKDNNSKLLILR